MRNGTKASRRSRKQSNMGLTKAQRHNKMMDRVFDQYHKNRKDPAIKSFKKHQVKIGKATHDHGDQYPGPKAAALRGRSMSEAMSSGLKGKGHFS